MPATIQNKPKYTYADYVTWPDTERWELIRGIPYDMTPAPGTRHQEIVGNLFFLFKSSLNNTRCRPFVVPFDVRFPSENTADTNACDTVVQPDISVICDRSQLDDRGCAGPPDLVVEVLSEQTGGRDEGIKRHLYQHHRVPEYWLVNPWDDTVRVYNLNEAGIYDFPRFYTKLDRADSCSIEGLEIKLNEVFPAQPQQQ